MTSLFYAALTYKLYDTYIKNWYFGKILKSFPFSSQILHTTQDNNMLEFMIVEVRSSERHHQVPQTNQRRIRISKETHHNMTIEHCHCCLVSVLEYKMKHEICEKCRYCQIIWYCAIMKSVVNNLSCSCSPVYSPQLILLVSSGTCQCCHISSQSSQNQSLWLDHQQYQHPSCLQHSCLQAWHVAWDNWERLFEGISLCNTHIN